MAIQLAGLGSSGADSRAAVGIAGSFVVGVVGGKGGIGASVFAAVLAAVAARRAAPECAVLVDLDFVSGGIDVLLGVESVPGPRWSGLALRGGHLSPEALGGALPRWGPVTVLAADSAPSADAVDQLMVTAARLGPVVVDLGRLSGAPRAVALARCDLVVLLCRADVVSVTAARAVRAELIHEAKLPQDRGTANIPLALVLRGDGPRRLAESTRHRVAELVGAPVIAYLPLHSGVRSRPPLSATGLPKEIVLVAEGILTGFASGDRDD